MRRVVEGCTLALRWQSCDEKSHSLQVVVLLCTERRKEYIPSFQPSKICKTSLACLVSSIKIDVRLLLTQDHGDHGNVFLHLASSTILHLAPWSCKVLSIQQWPNKRMLRPSNDEAIHHTGLMAWTLASQPAQIVWYVWVFVVHYISSHEFWISFVIARLHFKKQYIQIANQSSSLPVSPISLNISLLS